MLIDNCVMKHNEATSETLRSVLSRDMFSQRPVMVCGG